MDESKAPVLPDVPGDALRSRGCLLNSLWATWSSFIAAAAAETAISKCLACMGAPIDCAWTPKGLKYWLSQHLMKSTQPDNTHRQVHANPSYDSF